MTERLTLNWQDVQFYVNDILRQIQSSGWRPDLVMGVDRGGLVASTMISHYLEVPHESIKVSLRDNYQTESLLWAPEDVINGKKILIVDDINDSGATQGWIKKDWANAVLSHHNFVEKYWHKDIRWATLVENESSEESSDFVGITINKHENDVWIDFPWESWWSRSTQ